FEAALKITGMVSSLQYAVALVNLSWVYHQLNQFDTALDLGRRSIEHFRAANHLYGEAYAVYTIGNNALYLGRWQVAQEHLDQAVTIYAAAGMGARTAMVDCARGLLFHILGADRRSEAR